MRAAALAPPGSLHKCTHTHNTHTHTHAAQESKVVPLPLALLGKGKGLLLGKGDGKGKGKGPEVQVVEQVVPKCFSKWCAAGGRCGGRGRLRSEPACACVWGSRRRPRNPARPLTGAQAR